MIVSAHSKFIWVKEAIEAGAKGYVVKESGGSGIIKCLEAVARGDRFFDKSLSDKLYTYFDHGLENKREEENYGKLTAREQEVFRYIAEGITPKEIGDKLSISPKTVSSHRGNIMNKLGLSGTRDMVLYAAKLGIIDG